MMTVEDSNLRHELQGVEHVKRLFVYVLMGVFLFVWAFLVIDYVGNSAGQASAIFIEKENHAKHPESNMQRASVKRQLPSDASDQTVSKQAENAVTASDDQPKEPVAPPSPAHVKKVAITFDDGPHPEYTPAILNLLNQYEAKATFFMLGSEVASHPEIVKMVADGGHELGNHTWLHKNLTKLGPEGIMNEINRTNEAITKVTGKCPTIFRAPYGAINEQVKRTVNMKPVSWTVDTLDWKSHDPDAILNIVKRHTHDGSIILMHDIYASSADATAKVLNYLHEAGYEFVTLSELEAMEASK